MSYVDHIIESNDETGQQVSHEIRDANAQGRIATLEAGIDDVVDAATAAATQATQAAQTASDAAQRAEDAIDAIGDISELAVPEMSASVRGGAKLADDGGLELEDGALRIGSLVRDGDGTSAGPLAGATAKGWARQVSTTGKNLMVSYSSSTQQNGVTMTALADGGIKLSGTSTAAFSLQQFYKTAITLAPGTYTISLNNSNTANVAYQLITRSLATVVASPFDVLDKTRTFEISEETIIDRFGIYINNRVTLDLTIYPQLELGSTATAYEPYTGGEPSPSPDYPQEIEVARGRNLLDEGTLVNTDWNGCGAGLRVSNPTGSRPTVHAGETYTLSHDAGSFMTFFGVVSTDGTSKTDLSSSRNTTHKVTIPTAHDGKTLVVVFARPDLSSAISISDVTEVHPQLELGSTPTSYVPYGHVGLEARGRNLLLKDGYEQDSKTQNGVTFTKNADGSVSVKGTATSEVSYTVVNTAVLERGNTYTFSGGRDGVKHFFWFQGTTDWTNHSEPITRTIPQTGDWNFALKVESGATVDTIIYPQIEKGTTAHAYQPYHRSTTPIPLPSRGWAGALPDGTADALTIDGAGGVSWEKKTGGYIYTGQEPTKDEAQLGDYRRICLSDVIANAPSTSNTANCFCTKSVARVSYEGQFTHFYITTGSILCFAKATTNAEVLTAYKGAEFLYFLATPTTEHMGYVDLPDVPDGATVTIPELDALGVSYYVDGGAIAKATREWYQRLKAEIGGE